MHDLTQGLVSQPKNQEETVADQAEKVATQPEYDLLGHLSSSPHIYLGVAENVSKA